jgi:putative inorganic carbon (HCO3(-)) transporter
MARGQSSPVVRDVSLAGSAVASSESSDAPTLAVFRWAQVGMVIANLGRIPVISTGDREAPVAVNEIFLGVVLMVGFIGAIRARSLRVDSVALTAALFAAVGGISAVWTAQQYGLTLFELAVSLAYLARWVFYALLYVTLRAAIAPSGAVSLWRAVEQMLIVFAAFGIFQAAFLPGFAQIVYPDSRDYVDWDPQGHRLVSTVLEPNIAGAMLMIGVLVQLALISTGAPARNWRLLVMFVALALTLSRSSALGLMAGIAVIFAARGLSRRLLKIGAGIAVLFVVALPKFLELAMTYGKFNVGLDTSAGARVFSWLRALQVFADHPILGVGFNTYGYMAERYGWVRLGAAAYGSDGGLLFIAAMTGVIGLAIYCFMLWLILSRCRSVWRDASAPEEHRGLAIGTAASTVAVVVHSVFVNSILTTFVMEILWVLWAVVGIVAARPTLAALRSAKPAPRLVALRV